MTAGWRVSIAGVEPVRLLGSGGFGEVWLARQPNLDRYVAVKIGHRPFATDDDRRRFERECQALGRLSGHPHITEIYTSGFSDQLPYLVVEYVDGGTLAEHGPGLDEARLRAVTDELTMAVGAAHAIGVLHRDLKPANVLLRADGRAVLGDFGIARIADGTRTEAGGITASMAFAAPEILNGGTPSPAADIYGIGITMISAMLGRSPFAPDDVATLEEVVARVLQAEVPDLGPYGISPPFASLLCEAMDRDPASRPASTDELRRRLAELPPPDGAVPTAVAAAPAGRGTAPTPPARRPGSKRLVAAGAGLGLVALLVVAGFALSNRSAVDPDETSPRTSTLDDSAADTAPPDTAPSDTAPPDTAPPDTQSTATTIAPSPLVLPLTGSTISELTDIPLDSTGIEELLTPADNPQFCDERPDATGLTETVAAIYPVDPTAGGAFRQLVQRMHRFSTPDQASNFIRSYTTFSCESWESTEFSNDGVTLLTATAVPAILEVGDEIAQVDQVATLPVGVAIVSRTVLIRRATDVLKLVYFTLEPDEVGSVSDRLIEASIESLGY